MPPRSPPIRKPAPWISKIEITSRAQWRAWLETNHAQSNSIWLVVYKKTSPDKHVPYDAIVAEALCFGWVDSLPRKLDAKRSMLLLSPRRPGSAWSRINKERAEHLITAGLMTDAGFLKIKAAMKDGSWARLDVVETLVLPPDLAQALKSRPVAAANFDAFPLSVRRAILEWIDAAKRQETRAKRIAETAELAAKNIRANQWRQR